jgi:hypothetical protein
MLEVMQLRNARLCLNCEEIHAAAHCPVCTSESFASLSRWIPADERRAAPRQAGAEPRPARAAVAERVERAAPPAATAPAQTPAPARSRWVRRSAAGVAFLAASRILWELSRPVEWSSPTLPDDRESAAADLPPGEE